MEKTATAFKIQDKVNHLQRQIQLDKNKSACQNAMFIHILVKSDGFYSIQLPSIPKTSLEDFNIHRYLLIPIFLIDPFLRMLLYILCSIYTAGLANYYGFIMIQSQQLQLKKLLILTELWCSIAIIDCFSRS